jgi:hypothetical protein
MIGEFFLWLSGAEKKVLDRCPTERLKFVATGGVVLTAAALATLSATFTIHNFLGVPLVGAAILGIGWGVAIMNLDRWLLMSIRRQSTWYYTLVMALPRLFLAVIVGLVIAQPLLLTVFASEINTQVKEDKGQQLYQDRKNIERQYAKVEALRAKQKELQATATSPASDEALGSNPAYAELVSELRSLRHREATAQDRATCELDGLCGTKHVGPGTSYKRKLLLAEKVKREAEEVKSRLEAMRRELLASENRQVPQRRSFAEHRLQTVDKELANLESQSHAQEAQYVHDYLSKPGLLDRVEALSVLSKKHSSVRNLELLLWLLILAIDSMPAFAKTIMSLGRESLYEQILDRTEADALSSVNEQHKANATAHQIAATTIIKAAEARQQLELEARKDLTDQTVRAQKQVAETFISVWEKAMLPFASKSAQEWISKYEQRVVEEAAMRAADGSQAKPSTNGHAGNRERRPWPGS